MSAGSPTFPMAPELATDHWLNADEPIRLADLRGRVVAIEAFQMLCPGCVTHGLPQARRLADTFGDDLTVLGLHSVFEHHEAMRPVSLEAFLHEYRLGFPVGIDRHEGDDPTPVTMRRYGLRGTPSLLLVDRRGRLRANLFGHVDELALCASVARLIDEEPAPSPDPLESDRPRTGPACDPQDGCPRPVR